MALFYRIVTQSGDPERINPYACAHEWVRTEGTDAYCHKCNHAGTLVEDERNRSVEWWEAKLGLRPLREQNG